MTYLPATAPGICTCCAHMQTFASCWGRGCAPVQLLKALSSLPACHTVDLLLQEAAADQVMQSQAAKASAVAGEREQPAWRPAGAQAQAVVPERGPVLRGVEGIHFWSRPCGLSRLNPALSRTARGDRFTL